MENSKENVEDIPPEETHETDPNQQTDLVPVVLSSLSLKNSNDELSTSSEETDDAAELLNELILKNEDNESSSSDDEDSDSEIVIELPSVTDSEDSEDIVFEHTLKHSSFFQNARERRKRHLENRLRGDPGWVPSLNFTGSDRTDFWERYGVEPTKLTPIGNVQNVRTMLTDEEFKKLGPTERRIHVNGQKFKIVANSEITDSFYRTIAQAVGMLESEYNIVHEAILYEVAKQWPIFCNEVCAYIGKIPKDEAQQMDPKRTVEKYKKISTEKSIAPPYFELIAAALHFGFSFSLIELTTLEQPLIVKNCNNDRVLLKATAKFHFLKTGKHYPYYEFLLPIGPLKKIQDGMYETVIRDVILVETHRPWLSFDNRKPKYRPAIGQIPIGFALDHRIFMHRSTVSHDLWSLLAELIFRKLIHAPQIKRRILDSKHDFALYYLACKAKKRYQVHGNASIEKLAEDFSQRFSKEHPRGDIEDLVQASHYFDFSYTVIGLDSRGNFFWRDYVAQHEDNNNNNSINKKRGPYLAFFVKTMPDKMMFWYALEDVGRSCPKERKLYQDVQSGDLRQWGGRFYFHSTPVKVSSFIHQQRSSKYLVKSPTRMLSDASKWASSNFGKLRSTLTATISFVSLRTRSVFQSIFSFFKDFRKGRHKVYPDKNVQALFVREQP